MLVFGAIAPHGSDIVEELAADPAVMAQTRWAMQELGRRFLEAQPETVVVLTPHGVVVDGAISVGATDLASGSLGDAPPGQIQAAFRTDLELVEQLFAEAPEQRLPLARLVGEEGVQETVLSLDWGALVPLWYTAHIATPRPKVVILAPNRSLPRETLVRCGVAIARAAQASGRRVALLASCDQGHAHHPKGPYGFSPVAAEHDAAMCAIIRANDLPRLLTWPAKFLEKAKVDAYWQTIILAGALGHTPMQGELLSYEAPTYFGMAVAAYKPC
ncbi:MAG: hypothetical protein H7Z41_18610 [Cytophagales bacterium]|nr:hypothetical protein [Armatimonadota bacterium]